MGSSGGKAAAIVLRQKALDRYYANPTFCLECGKMLTVKINQKVQSVREKKFCNHSCSANFNNRKYAKIVLCEICGQPVEKTSRRQRKWCNACTEIRRIADVGKVTKKYLFDKRSSYQSARSQIRRHAEMMFNNSGRERACVVCGYTNHVEVAHRKAVADFSGESTLEEINSLDNLLGLCPNHHWEFDTGLLEV
jgi:uncharacterized CHY-type Zn-finger protein